MITAESADELKPLKIWKIDGIMWFSLIQFSLFSNQSWILIMSAPDFAPKLRHVTFHFSRVFSRWFGRDSGHMSGLVWFGYSSGGRYGCCSLRYKLVEAASTLDTPARTRGGWGWRGGQGRPEDWFSVKKGEGESIIYKKEVIIYYLKVSALNEV